MRSVETEPQEPGTDTGLTTDSLPTRATLLSRIKDISQNESWREFFDTYWKLIYNTARKSGLDDFESQEVVQETMIHLSRTLPEFKYDPQKSFKKWLRNLTLWRIKDQLKKRSDYGPLTAFISDACHFEQQWEEEWRKNIINTAIERVRARFSPQNFQIYTLSDLQHKGARGAAQVLRISTTRVYLITHRIRKAIQKEIQRIHQQGNE